MAIPDVVSADPRVYSTPDDPIRADRDNPVGMGRDAQAAAAPRPPAAAGAVNRLLEHPALWRAGQLQRAPATHATGFTELDAQLPGGGWPRAGLAEFLLGTTGIGELRVLAPLIRTLSREQARWIAWINPPFTPYAPALEALGIELDRMLVISPRSHAEALWALEQTSRSGSCSLALAWLDEHQLTPQETRRLQFAAQQGQMLTCLFRPEQAAAVQSMAELRLQLAPSAPGSLVLDIRKRRGGWPVSGIRLTIDAAERPESVLGRLSNWRQYRRQLAADAAVAAPVAGHDASSAHDEGRTGRDGVSAGGNERAGDSGAGRRWSVLGADPARALLETVPPVTH